MEFAITKLSTKGQIVIPSNLRSEFKVGDEFLLVKEKNNIVLKRMDDVAKKIADDIKFANKVEKAWQSYESGRFTKKSKRKFLAELEKW